MPQLPLLKRIFVAVVRPPVIVLRFVFGRFYDLLFAKSDLLSAKDRQDRLQADIRECLPFLFTD
jgi:hypothetical protein